MPAFLEKYMYVIVSLIFCTGLSWFIGSFFASRRTLGIFFGAWYVTLLVFIAGGEIAAYTSPWCFIFCHLAIMSLLGWLCRVSFIWKQYALLCLASLLFSLFTLLCMLEAALEIQGYK